MPIPHYGDFFAEEIFLQHDPVMAEVRAELWPDPEPAPHGEWGARQWERRGTYRCPVCRQLTIRVGICSAGMEDGPCEQDVCLWCGYSSVEQGPDGPFVLWQCRACGPPTTGGRCPDCGTYGGQTQIGPAVWCAICTYHRDVRLYWGVEEE